MFISNMMEKGFNLYYSFGEFSNNRLKEQLNEMFTVRGWETRCTFVKYNRIVLDVREAEEAEVQKFMRDFYRKGEA